jgi:hypothetical protein
MEEYKEGVESFFFVSHTIFELGDESKIRFRDDVWCGEMTLKEAFPVLYGIAH